MTIPFDLYDARFIWEYWAFADGWADDRLPELVTIPLSTIRVIPLFPEYSWLDKLGAAGTWQTILDKLKSNEVIGQGWPVVFC